ncbi:MAG: helix-turn-helix domain-containing protein [Bacteroidota bacterium]
MGIALESGFNSKSTFNRAFKKQTQHTPKEYFNQLLQSEPT